MNATATICSVFATLLSVAAVAAAAQEPPRREVNPEAKLHRFSTTVEKERPELDEETKRLIAAFRRDPSDASRAALRAKVTANYDAVLARKKAKLWAEKGQKVKEIKGGSWYAHRASCRTESRGEGRAPSLGYNTVGFRVVREDR